MAPPGGTWGQASQYFLKLAERTKDIFSVGEDTAEIVHVRKQYDEVHRLYDRVHYEAEQKDARCRKVKEEIRSADLLHMDKAEEVDVLESQRTSLAEQLLQTDEQIKENKTNRKVYEHMLARTQKEQAILRQKMLLMAQYKDRKDREYAARDTEYKHLASQRVQFERELTELEQDATVERKACDEAHGVMTRELDRQSDSNERRATFEKWRAEIALEAANDAFNKSAGRLRKLYAIEKLVGSCLQKRTIEQVEKTQQTEENFHRIREVTGLSDVMLIVHKFLNREEEHKQLDGSSKEAMVHLEKLRQDYEALKRDTENITFDQYAGDRGDIYKEVERSERRLSEAMEGHEAARARLQRITLQTEHMQRWADRVGNVLVSFEAPAKVESSADLKPFFTRLSSGVNKFLAHVGQQVNDVSVTKLDLTQIAKKEHEDQKKLLNNPEFLKGPNNRVPRGASENTRPGSNSRNGGRSGGGPGSDNPDDSFLEDRERSKSLALELLQQKEKEQRKVEGKKDKEFKPRSKGS